MIVTSDNKPVFPSIATKIEQDAASFAGLSLCPLYFVDAIASNYYFLREDSMVNASPALVRAPGTPFARSVTALGNDAYKCENYGHEEPVSLEENAKYASPGQAEAAALRRGHRNVLLGHETRVAALAMGATVPTAAVGVTWDDPNGDPLDDVGTARQQIFYGCGREANVMTCGREVYEALKGWARRVGLIKLSDKDARWTDLLAAVFDVERFVVARAVTDAANEGQAVSLGQIWGNSVMLAWVDFTEDFKVPSFGRTFCSDKPTDFGVTLSGYTQENIKSGVARAEQSVAEKPPTRNVGFA